MMYKFSYMKGLFNHQRYNNVLCTWKKPFDVKIKLQVCEYKKQLSTILQT